MAVTGMYAWNWHQWGDRTDSIEVFAVQEGSRRVDLGAQRLVADARARPPVLG